MNVHFEELSAAKRAGGIDAACTLLAGRLAGQGIRVTRSSSMSVPSHSLNPTCVHIHGLWSPRLAMKIIHWKRRGVPVVVSPHGMLDRWALSHKPVRKKIAWLTYQKRLLDQADILHATSEREAAQFATLKLNAKTIIVPWGVDVSSITPQSNRPAPTAPAMRTALFLGRLYPVKGLPNLIEAWSRVRPEGWQLRIVGPDEAGHRGELERLVSRLALQDAIVFTGPLTGSAKDQAYAQAELFVAPSHTENFGMAIGEALAAGLPVLTTTGTPWESITKASCGWYVEPTVEAITSALDDATRKTSAQLRAMGESGQQLIQSRFNWDSVTSQFIDLYNTCISHPDTQLRTSNSIVT